MPVAVGWVGKNQCQTANVPCNEKTGTQIKHGGRHIVPTNFLICEGCTVVNNYLSVMGGHNCEICILLGQVVM